MRPAFALFPVLFFLLSSCASKKKVALEVFSQKQYCGGARPTPEIERQSKLLRPYENKPLIIVSESGKTIPASTDSLGRINVTLKKGVYRLMEPWRFERALPGGKTSGNFDKKCLEEEWKQHHMLITVAGEGFIISEQTPVLEYCEWRLPCALQSADDNIPD